MAVKYRNKRKKSVIRSLAAANTNTTIGMHVPISIFIIILIAGLMVGAIWQKVKINELKSDVDDLYQQVQVCKEKNEEKVAKKLTLLSDYRITDIAKEQIGLIFPPYEVVTLPDDFYNKLHQTEKIVKINEGI